MTTFVEVIAILLLFSLFALVHSALASFKIKKWFKGKLGNKIAFYRAGYNLFSLITFFLIWEYSPQPDYVIYDLHYPYDIIIFILQSLSLLGIFWAGSVVEMGEFIGYGQIKRYFLGIYNESDLDEKPTLYIRGPFKFTRHPIYFFFILFLGLRPTMDLFYVTFYVGIIVYFYIGSIYEEKKLIDIFGDKYLNYRKVVPGIIPYKFVNKEELKNLLD